ncbi:Aldolase-type TIM barrel [Moorella glycerini]|uniref:dihydrouracil dehydrogenase (NAD(+)) n=1 Tax=Neomoorella stamsii TaxID=1266720 RepID=A0A9X7P7J6_9FIRM|nr:MULTISPECIES: 4Fe-4S binding protein [Moorella]PRR77111.1 NAD-dependent dihydropyrimidine dehydrogenase subunit PreA [Moorella stamsii]CEP66860.1 Aldolase-type TIM barrel [Moorella glycerini]
MADLSVELAGLRFKNPVVAASGPIAHSSTTLEKAIKSGLGGVVTKTCTATPYFRTYPRMEEYLLDFELDPHRIFAHPKGWALYHRDHLQHQDPEVWVKIIKEKMPLAKEYDCRIIGSIEGGLDANEWKKLAKMHAEAGVEALELNCCCPHPGVVSTQYQAGSSGAVGASVGKNAEAVAKAVKAVKEVTGLPVFVKLTPEAEDPAYIAKVAQEAGADGATIISRNLSLRIDIETGKAIGYTYCSTSGPGTKEFSMRWVAATAQLCNIPILASNGPVEPEDFIEFMMAGATVVETCTALMVYGYRYVKEILKGMEEFLDRKGYNARDIIGMALPLGPSSDIPVKFKAKYGVVDRDKCNGCKRCEEACFYDALRIENRKSIIDPDRCVGCGFCQYLCPQKAISYLERASEEEYIAALHKSL